MRRPAREFAADLRPFLRVSHPLGYRPGIPVEDRRSIEAYLGTAPPAHIVVDGGTEQVYLRHLPTLRALLHRAYRLELTAEGGRHPVRVYTHAARTPAAGQD